MPSIDNWTGSSAPLSSYLDVDQGVDTAILIADKSTSITLIRDGAALAAQTVRIEQLDADSSVGSQGRETGTYDVGIIGYKGHPTMADTDIRRGDRFAVAGVLYEVGMLMPGEVNSVQAYAKVRG